jgi:hypothetical protein
MRCRPVAQLDKKRLRREMRFREKAARTAAFIGMTERSYSMPRIGSLARFVP